MIQISTTGKAEAHSHAKGQHHNGGQLGSILCWAVVFADVGTSIYYVPGILYGNVGNLAGFFVMLTMSVFVLLTLKYAEITHRFPQGGGVVTVAAQAMNSWMGALGGMFILVDYFLTAAISCLSGILYLSVVFPALGPFVLEIALIVLVLLGILNWVGVSESAKVSLIGAAIAFASDIAILLTVFTHISFSEFFSLFPRMFAGQSLTPVSLLIGFAGSFLAFSGLESISQLSPVIKAPRKKIAAIAMLFVVLTVGITSPLLTMFSTLLLPQHVLRDPVLSAQVISLLGGHWGNLALQTEVAISASGLLIFASNTAIIGTYHVFIALSRMEFFPSFILRRNKMRGTPHFSILLATVIPIVILIAVQGNITLLGDMYAFGLLGAFTLTCIGLDLVRGRERRAARKLVRLAQHAPAEGETARMGATPTEPAEKDGPSTTKTGRLLLKGAIPSPYTVKMLFDPWHTFKFYIGLLTTALVLVAWTTNLAAKPMATVFGGTVTAIGMGIAYFNYRRRKQEGHVPVAIPHVEEYMPGSILAVLFADDKQNEAVIHSALENAQGRPVVFLYLAVAQRERAPRLFEYHNPYHEDRQAKKIFARAKYLARKAHVRRVFVYHQQEPGILNHVWSVVHPYDAVISAERGLHLPNMSADRIRYEITPETTIVHVVKDWDRDSAVA